MVMAVIIVIIESYVTSKLSILILKILKCRLLKLE